MKDILTDDKHWHCRYHHMPIRASHIRKLSWRRSFLVPTSCILASLMEGGFLFPCFTFYMTSFLRLYRLKLQTEHLVWRSKHFWIQVWGNILTSVSTLQLLAGMFKRAQIKEKRMLIHWISLLHLHHTVSLILIIVCCLFPAPTITSKRSLKVSEIINPHRELLKTINNSHHNKNIFSGLVDAIARLYHVILTWYKYP